MAIQQNKPKEIQKIINETKEIIKTKPKSFFYFILYLAYLNNNQADKAKQTLDYARYLYPSDLQLANIDKPRKNIDNSTSKAQSTAVKQ